MLLTWLIVALQVLACVSAAPSTPRQSTLDVGTGIYDVTGPVGGVNFMGYASVAQVTQGVHMRLRARCFVFRDAAIVRHAAVYCSLDVPMLSQNVKRGVVDRLRSTFGEDVYNERNVMLSATHTHAGPGGYHEYLLYGITALGHVPESAALMVDGIFNAIVRAHDSLAPSRLYSAMGSVYNASRNRSPFSYLANPAVEREVYAAEGDTDKTMTVVRVVDDQGDVERGMLSWFPVHGVSMNNTNRLVSGDNKGYASYLMEAVYNRQLHRLGKDEHHPYTSDEARALAANGMYFVAAFGQSNEGDVTPNIEGAFCLNTGKPCDCKTSTCPDHRGRLRSELCHARGPGYEKGDWESTRIIGLRQYLKANELYASATKPFSRADVDFAHAWVDMSATVVALANGSLVQTCKPARGYSFAAGTADGPGEFDFIQGDNSTGNPLWNVVRQFIAKPSAEQIRCHWPKPILLDTGEIHRPYPWEPTVVDLQIIRVGDLVIVAVPGEFTTMAGRRLRAAVGDVFVKAGVMTPADIRVVIAGLSNSYAGYVTTFEEYQVQRYEGASTIYGPHALDAYIQEFTRLAVEMVGDKAPPRTPAFPPPSHDKSVGPLDFTKKLITLLPPVVFDAVPLGRRFGQIVDDVRDWYGIGDLVQATFHAGHPRNVAQSAAMQLEHSFMTVEKYVGPAFEVVRVALEDWLRGSTDVRGRVSVRVSGSAFPDRLDVVVTGGGQASRFLMQDVNDIVQDDPVHVVLKNVTMIWNGAGFHIVPAAATTTHATTATSLWRIIRDDNDWDTRFHWSKPVAGVLSVSYVRLEWTVGALPTHDDGVIGTASEVPFVAMHESMSGLYRLHYFGADKTVLGHIRKHEGVSGVFGVGMHSTSSWRIPFDMDL